MLPLQQPVGHVDELQVHCPLLLSHAWFAAHAAQAAPAAPQEALDSDPYASHVPLVPPLQQPAAHVLASHEHMPAATSHRPLAQETHAAPPLPHWEPDCDAYGTQTLPLQHPFAHDVASQVHAPVVLLHSWPVVHAPQAAPAVPHVVLDSDAYGTHVLPLQQPFGHEVESQTQAPALHS